MGAPTKARLGNNPAGRPRVYDDSAHPQIVAAFANASMTDEKMYELLGIPERTFYRWKDDHPRFSQALSDPKKIIDEEVVSKLLQRAMGCEIVETRVYNEELPEMDADGNHKTKKHVEKTTKQILPSVAACIFWLKNRRPDLWRDSQEITIPAVTAIFKGLKGPVRPALEEAPDDEIEAEVPDSQDSPETDAEGGVGV